MEGPPPTQYLLSLANHDFNELIQPALSGLADEDCHCDRGRRVEAIRTH